jgi:hypothetical protein
MPQPPHTRLPPLARTLIILMMLALLASSAAYSGKGPVAGGAGPSPAIWGPTLATIARALTLPLDTPSAADVRYLILPAATVIGLLLLTAQLFAIARDAAAGGRPYRFGDRAVGPGFDRAALITLLAAFVSAAYINHMADLGFGWLLASLCGVLWAVCIRGVIPPRFVSFALAAALVTGGVVFGLTLWHRHQLRLAYLDWPVGALTPAAGLAALIGATAAARLIAPFVLERIGSRRSGPPTRLFGSASAKRPNSPNNADRAQAGNVATSSREVGSEDPTCGAPRGATDGWLTRAVMALVALAALACLWIAQRRAPLLGAGAGLVGGAGVLLLTAQVTSTIRKLRTAFIAAIVIGGVATTAWLINQARSDDASVSGSVGYRLTYWRESIPLIAEKPLLGHGPDGFARVMTPRMAGRHFSQPHVYAGNIDNEAHNEWLQAVVELGLIGGLAWLALPLIVLRRATIVLPRHDMAVPRRAAVIALCAGLIAVLVSEAASTSLRGPVLPIWYWTWLGLLLAALRTDDTPGLTRVPANKTDEATLAGIARACRAHAIVRMLLAGVIGLFVYQQIGDMRAQSRHRRNGAAARETTTMAVPAWTNRRWRQSEWFTALADYSSAILTRVNRDADAFRDNNADGKRTGCPSPSCEQAVNVTQRIAVRFPGMLNHELNNARALSYCARFGDARNVLINYRQHVSRYNPQVNLFLARNLSDPATQLDLLVDALRSAAVTPDVENLLATLAPDLARDDSESRKRWLDRTRIAIESIKSPIDEEHDNAPEVLRLEAARLWLVGDGPAAVAAQQAAAVRYRDLRETGSRFRRAADAEWDAWYQLARMIHETDPGQYAIACEAIRQAEEFALLGYPHARIAGATDDDELLGGQLRPTTITPHLRPLWRLSAKLHAVANRVGQAEILMRVALAQPDPNTSPESLSAALRALLTEAVADFEQHPQSNRPPYFDQLKTMTMGSR